MSFYSLELACARTYGWRLSQDQVVLRMHSKFSWNRHRPASSTFRFLSTESISLNYAPPSLYWACWSRLDYHQQAYYSDQPERWRAQQHTRCRLRWHLAPAQTRSADMSIQALSPLIALFPPERFWSCPTSPGSALCSLYRTPCSGRGPNAECSCRAPGRDSWSCPDPESAGPLQLSSARMSTYCCPFFEVALFPFLSQ